MMKERLTDEECDVMRRIACRVTTSDGESVAISNLVLIEQQNQLIELMTQQNALLNRLLEQKGE